MKNFLNGIWFFVPYILSIVKVAPVIGIKEIYYYLILNRIFGVKKDLKVDISGNKFIIPNIHQAFHTLHEVFTWGLYKKLNGCKHVLDLGGFLGDTGVYLGAHNAYVDIYEPNKVNFEYIQKNIYGKQNIQAYNRAVIASDRETYYEGGSINAGGKVKTTGTEKVENIHIRDILVNKYDGIKMDIEGGEYEIVEYLIKNGQFGFLKGYIEFHQYTQASNKKTIDDLISYLRENQYAIYFEDIHGGTISHEDIFNQRSEIFILYFEHKID